MAPRDTCPSKALLPSQDAAFSRLPPLAAYFPTFQHSLSRNQVDEPLDLFSAFPESGWRPLPLGLNISVLSNLITPVPLSSAHFLADPLLLCEPWRRLCLFQMFISLPEHKLESVLSPVSQLCCRNKLWIVSFAPCFDLYGFI